MKKVIFIIIGTICLLFNAATAHVSPLKDYKLAVVSRFTERFTEYFRYHGLPLEELMPFIHSLQEINSKGIDSQEIDAIIASINSSILQSTSVSIESGIGSDSIGENPVKYLTYCFGSKKRKIYFLTERQARFPSIRDALGIAEKDLHLLQVPTVTNVWIANPRIDLSKIIGRLIHGWPEYEDIKRGDAAYDVEFVIDPIERKQILAVTTDWHTGRKIIARQRNLSNRDIAEIVSVLGNRKIVLDREVSVADGLWSKIGRKCLPSSIEPGQSFPNDKICTIYLGGDVLQVVYSSIGSGESWASYVSQARSLFNLEKAIDEEFSVVPSRGIIKLDVRCLSRISDSVRENLRKYLLKIDQEDMVALELISDGLEPVSDIEEVLRAIGYPEFEDVISRLVRKAGGEEFKALERTAKNTIALMYPQGEKPLTDKITVIYLERGENPQLIHGMSLARYIISIGGPQSAAGSALTLIRNAYKAMVGTEYDGRPIDEMEINEILQNIRLPIIATPDLRTTDTIYQGLLAIDASA